ncbi:MAG: NAD-binding protein [Acidimicrobiales bacterium]|nr:NAD-binding protein [Acidimicrobiales bacterium]
MSERVAVIGIGIMGEPMARNLRRAGFEVTAFDLDPARMAAVAEVGIDPAPSPGVAAASAGIVLLSLPGVEAVDAVLFGPDGVAAHATAGTVVIDTTTSVPVRAAEQARHLAERGIAMLDAPVSGGRTGAEEATLSIMVGGPSATLERARPVLEALGRRITHLGEAVGAGGYGKLVNQIFVSIHFAAIAEGLTFAQRAGLDVEQLLPALQAGWADSTVLGVKAPQILDRAFDRPIGTVAVQHKDLRYINDAAAEFGMSLPFSGALLGLYDELVADGKSALDQIALIHLFERAAGVTVQRRPSAG